MLGECIQDNYYARFDARSHHCFRELHYNARLDVNCSQMDGQIGEQTDRNLNSYVTPCYKQVQKNRITLYRCPKIPANIEYPNINFSISLNQILNTHNTIFGYQTVRCILEISIFFVLYLIILIFSLIQYCAPLY